MSTATLFVMDGKKQEKIAAVFDPKLDWVLETKNGAIFPVAMKAMKSALDKAVKATAEVNVLVPQLDVRRAHYNALVDRFKELDTEGGPLSAFVRLEWCGTLRTALALHYDAVANLKKKKEKLKLDTGTEARRLSDLDVLLSSLDVAGFNVPLATGAKTLADT